MENNLAEFMKIGAYWTETQLKDIKEKMELRCGFKLSKSKPQGFIRFLCKNKKCEFFFEYRQVCDGDYIFIRCNPNHNCCGSLTPDQLAFYKNRKMIIDKRQAIYMLMKERYPIHGFEKPKKLLSILQDSRRNTDLLTRIQSVEIAEDRRKLKKKFDNIVAEIRAQLCQEDPEIKMKMAQEKKERKRSRKSSRKKLTADLSSDQEVRASRSRSRKRPTKKQEPPVSRTGKTGKGLMLALYGNTSRMEDWLPFQEQEDFYFLNQRQCEKNLIEEFDIKEEPGQNKLTITKNVVTRKKNKEISDDSDWTGIENKRRN